MTEGAWVCANCERSAGKLEQPREWGNYLVCVECYDRLASLEMPGVGSPRRTGVIEVPLLVTTVVLLLIEFYLLKSGVLPGVITACLVIGSSIWAGLDSKRQQIEDHAWVWFLGCLLLWIIFFPWYLYVRARCLKAKGTNPLLGTMAGTAMVAANVLVLVMLLAGEVKMSTSDLQAEVQQNIASTWSKQPSTAIIEIDSFTLVHKDGNQYEGVLQATANGVPATLMVDVTYDGKRYAWHIRW